MDAVYKGMKPELLNNLYALLYQKAAYEITKEVTGDGIVWARAAWAGCQRYPLHWGGDSCSSWDGMAGSKEVYILVCRGLLSGVMMSPDSIPCPTS